MAAKIEIIDNALVITDTTNSEVIHDVPAKDYYFDNTQLKNGSVQIYDLYGLNEDLAKIFTEALANTVDKDDVVFTEQSFRDFARLNMGKSSGGAASIPTGDLFNGGFFDYNDLETATNPITITVVGSPVTLTNDGLGDFTNKTYAPTGVSDVWDATNDCFDWGELKLGDMVDIRLDFNLTTSSVNTQIKVDLHLGIGAGEYTIPFVTEANFKDTGLHKINRFNGVYMGDLNTLNNPGKFKITTDKDCTAVVNGWYCKVIRKG